MSTGLVKEQDVVCSMRTALEGHQHIFMSSLFCPTLYPSSVAVKW